MTSAPGVSRFGKILLLAQTFKNISQTFEDIFSVMQNFEPNLTKDLKNFGQIWADVSSQIFKNILAIWSHWVGDVWTEICAEYFTIDNNFSKH